MKKNPDPHFKKKPFNSYLKYSGLAFQLVAVILAGVFIGNRMDRWLSLESPVFTLVFPLLFNIVFIIIIVRQIMKS